MSRWKGAALVYGEAQTQGSKRIGRVKGTGRPIVLDDNPRLKSWRGQMQEAMEETAPPQPIDGPVGCSLTVAVLRPKSHFGTGKNAKALKDSAPAVPSCGKDLDKIARAVGDAGSGLWWRDDSRIVYWEIRRVYSEREFTSVGAWEVGL
jgi:Holliday junction resolvase RusA-like endonuclease